MIGVYLYGKLRRFADTQDATRDSVVRVPVREGDTIEDILVRIGIPFNEVGNNIFLNWQYSALNRRVKGGDRLAVFPDDMQLLYRQYFQRISAKEDDRH